MSKPKTKTSRKVVLAVATVAVTSIFENALWAAITAGVAHAPPLDAHPVGQAIAHAWHAFIPVLGHALVATWITYSSLAVLCFAVALWLCLPALRSRFGNAVASVAIALLVGLAVQGTVYAVPMLAPGGLAPPTDVGVATAAAFAVAGVCCVLLLADAASGEVRSRVRGLLHLG